MEIIEMEGMIDQQRAPLFNLLIFDKAQIGAVSFRSAIFVKIYDKFIAADGKIKLLSSAA
jgi:hypothetical protein